MLNKINLLELLLVISVLFIKQTNGLQCFSCTYCGDPFSNNSYPLVTCSAGYNYCAKTVYYVSRNGYNYMAVRGNLANKSNHLLLKYK
jgi:hypothetical protein